MNSNEKSGLFIISGTMLAFILMSSILVFPVWGEEQPDTAYYEIRSNVENASVYLDDLFAGNINKGSLMVPAETSNKPVYHLLRIEAPGYTTYNETILQAPKPGKSNVYRGILTLLPPPSIGSLSIAVSPPGGEVFLDGKSYGIVDQSGIFTFRDIPAGYQVVQISLAGYEPWVERVFVEANMNNKVRVTLTPVTTGSLQVTSEPASASILLNGAPVGITPVTIPDLSPGPMNITLTLAGYQDLHIQASVNVGQVVSVSGTLVPVVVSTPEPVEDIPQSTPIPEPTQAPLSLLTIGGALAVLLYQKKR